MTGIGTETFVQCKHVNNLSMVRVRLQAPFLVPPGIWAYELREEAYCPEAGCCMCALIQGGRDGQVWGRAQLAGVCCCYLWLGDLWFPLP